MNKMINLKQLLIPIAIVDGQEQGTPFKSIVNEIIVAKANESEVKEQSRPVINFQSFSITIVKVLLQIFKIINSLLMTFAYILLVFQTFYILNAKQPKYINLRHLALKWLSCIFLHLLKLGFSDNTDVNSQMAAILINLIIIFIAYPSKVLKAVHLKYFSHKEQQRYHDSVADPHMYDLTFTAKIAISTAVFLLNICKHLIAFVLPNHRRPIQEALRAVNTVVIDRKCFWSIYKQGNEQQLLYEKDKTAIKDFLIAGSSLTTPKGFNPPAAATIQQQNSIKQGGRDIIKAYGQKCSNLISNGFKPIKRVSIKYSIFQSKLQLLDLDFAKSQTYILEELTEKDSNVLEFTVLAPGQRVSEPIYIKFKTARQLEIFMRSIQQSEKIF